MKLSSLLVTAVFDGREKAVCSPLYTIRYIETKL
jgi:hypothetical protein